MNNVSAKVIISIFATMCILTYFLYLVDSLAAFLVPYFSSIGCHLRLFFIFLADHLCKRGFEGFNKRIRARIENGHESIVYNTDNPRMNGMRTTSL